MWNPQVFPELPAQYTYGLGVARVKMLVPGFTATAAWKNEPPIAEAGRIPAGC